MRVLMQKLTFGEKFTALREATGRTQEETAALLKKPLGGYKKLEEDFTFPTDSMLHRIAALYNISYEEVVMYGETDY